MVERSIHAAAWPRTVWTWVQAVRPLSLTASVVPVSLGATVAATQGLFNPGLFLLTLLAAVAIQGAATLFSAYFQQCRGLDAAQSYERGSAGVRGLLRPNEARLAGLALVGLASAIGLYLTLIRGAPIVVLGVLAAVSAYFYSRKPIAYRNRALGDPMIFLLFGPLTALGAYYVQTVSFELVPMLYALPVGCLATALLQVNSLRGGPVDGPALWGTAPRASGLAGGTNVGGQLAAAYLIVIAGAASGMFVRWTALALVSAPLAWMLVKQVTGARASQDPARLDVAASRLHLVFGLLLVVGVLLPAT